MKHRFFLGDPNGFDEDWHCLNLISEFPQDIETLEALAFIIPAYKPNDDRFHGDHKNRLRCLSPVLENLNGSQELRLVSIPPRYSNKELKKERKKF